MNFIFAILLIFLSIFSEIGFARFVHSDADKIDQEEDVSVENFNDKISYRYPNNWIKQWQETSNGLRINAGSLTTSVFDYSHDIKMSSEVQSPFYIAYSQWKHEDFTDDIFLQELKLAAKWHRIEFSLLADGSGTKEFGDLGFGLSYKADLKKLITFQLWSVDHYYNTKKQFAQDARNSSNLSYIAKGAFSLFATNLSFYFEHEPLIEWKRMSEGYTYTYKRKAHSIDAEHSMGSYLGYVKYTSDVKCESKFFTDETYKDMERFHYDFTIGARSGGDQSSQHDAGIQIINRNAYYLQSPGIGQKGEFFSESMSPARSIRNENGLYYTLNQPAPFGRYQLGAFINTLALTEEILERNETEIKIGTAIDWAIAANSRLFVNTTWDIDQMWSDYTKNATLRPWGGGNLQFQVVF